MLTVADALTELGFRNLEVVPADHRWISIVDADGSSGRAFDLTDGGKITSDTLKQIDVSIAELTVSFLVVVHGELPELEAEFLRTWDYPCPCTVVSIEELERSTQAEASVPVTTENPNDFFRKSGEEDLAVLERLRPRLLDLTLRNPLLNFRSRGSRTVPIVDELPRLVMTSLLGGKSMRLDAAPEGDQSKAVRPEHKNRITVTAIEGDASSPDTDEAESGGFELPQDPGSGTVAARHRDQALQTPFAQDALNSRLSGIFRDQETAIESTGINPLYLAVGFLHWYESPDESKPRLAPLLLVPVTIARHEVSITVPVKRGDEGWDPNGPPLQRKKVREYQYDLTMSGEEVIANECLVRKIDSNFRLVIPRLDESVEEGQPIDPEAYFRQVASVIARLKTDQRWKVRREIALGFFSFVKLLEWQDLDPANWKSDPNGLLERMLSAKESIPSSRESDDERADDFHLTSPVPVVQEADSSQTAVLSRALAGEDLVVQGPPGTGKTQTITNLIACALGSGKRVLFVAEKLAALNAAREKLEAAGLSEFCLELHSHKATPAAALMALHLRMQRGQIAPIDLDGHRRALRPGQEALNGYASLMATKHGHQGDRLEQILWRADVSKLALINCISDQTEPPRLALESGHLMDAPGYVEAKSILSGIAELAGESIPTLARPWAGFRPNDILSDGGRSILDAVHQMVDSVNSVSALKSGAPSCPLWSLSVSQWLIFSKRVMTVPEPTSRYQEHLGASAHSPQRATMDAFVRSVEQLRIKRSVAKSVIAELPESGDYQPIALATAALLVRCRKDSTKDDLRSLLMATERAEEAIATVMACLPAYLTRIGVTPKVTWRHLTIVLALVRNPVPTWIRIGVAGVILGTFSIGLTWPYLFGLPGTGAGALAVAIGAALLLAAGLTCLVTDRHERTVPRV